MTTYAGIDDFPEDVTITDDGDDEDASSVNVTQEALLDRTKSLHLSRTALADLAALTAITTPADGAVRHVKSFGFFVFDSGASAGLSPFALAADDLTAGAWVSSTAHETTRDVWVSAEHARYITSAALSVPEDVVPSLNPAFISMSRGDLVLYSVDTPGTGVAFIASTDGSKSYGLLIPIDAFMIHGARLATVTLKYKPGATHGADPAHFPALAVVKRDQVSTAPVALLSSSGGILADAGGTYIAERSLVYTCDQNHDIDAGASYAIHLWNEHGANANADTAFHGFLLHFTNIPNARRS